MKFGIMFANVLGFTRAEGAVAIAQAAEASGFESLWAVEHVVVPARYESEYPYSDSGRMPGTDDVDIPDPLVWLAYVAAATNTIRLATGILILAERNPVVTAKEVATLDLLSNGRVTLGVGVGWLREEFEAIGVPFERRGRRLDENIAAMRALWTQDLPTYQGEFVSFTNAICRPHPAQSSVPIVIGGHTDAAARRAGRLGDGFFPGKGDFEHLVAVMRDAATDAGRDPDAIELTSGGEDALGPDALDSVARLADLGVERIVIPPLAFDADNIHDALARYGDEVIAKA
ncbi:MAG TPA: LLM class F420-dependent oxidoreductase [Acidimicrobiales bacterium]|jgi:probable F420-dependent oxidoreductase|nr:LLM class F420-dependent oxidoreductase [Acidimicrobiales bacterium]